MVSPQSPRPSTNRHRAEDRAEVGAAPGRAAAPGRHGFGGELGQLSTNFHRDNHQGKLALVDGTRGLAG